MCSLCDGKTYEDLLEETDDRIERFGFTMVGVEADPDHPPWIYTIGLVEACGHPELAMLGIPIELAAGVISELATRVLDGDVVTPGDDVLFAGVPFHVGPVDERLWAGDRFAQWHAYYDWLGDPPEPAAVEVIPCGSWHDGVLAEPPPPNRAARRAQRRQRRTHDD